MRLVLKHFEILVDLHPAAADGRVGEGDHGRGRGEKKQKRLKYLQSLVQTRFFVVSMSKISSRAAMLDSKGPFTRAISKSDFALWCDEQI
jgi:hypothetical protein